MFLLRSARIEETAISAAGAWRRRQGTNDRCGPRSPIGASEIFPTDVAWTAQIFMSGAMATRHSERPGNGAIRGCVVQRRPAEAGTATGLSPVSTSSENSCTVKEIQTPPKNRALKRCIRCSRISEGIVLRMSVRTGASWTEEHLIKRGHKGCCLHSHQM